MPVDRTEIEKGIDILKRHGASRVYLFGSALTAPQAARDIDFGCEGIPPDKYFRAAAELGRALDREVDLVRFDDDHPRIRVMRRRAQVIYDAA